MVTVRLVTGDRPPEAGAPNSAFTTGCGAGGVLQAKSRRRRCGGSGPSSMAAPGLPGLPLSLPPPLPPPPPRPPGPAPPAPASAARPAAGARGSNTNTTPRFRDAAAAGKRRGRAGVQTRQAPATCTGDSPAPREASGRAGAGNLKIKSKQTRPVEKRERPGQQGNGLGSHCLRFSLFFCPNLESRSAKWTFTSLPGCRR